MCVCLSMHMCHGGYAKRKIKSRSQFSGMELKEFWQLTHLPTDALCRHNYA